MIKIRFDNQKTITSFVQLYSLTVICAMWAAVLTNIYTLKDTTGVNLYLAILQRNRFIFNVH